MILSKENFKCGKSRLESGMQVDNNGSLISAMLRELYNYLYNILLWWGVCSSMEHIILIIMVHSHICIVLCSWHQFLQ